MEIVWTSGLPSKPGIYWFDPGFRLDPIDHPMVIKVWGGGTTYGYGDFGSGPIDCYYSPEVCPKARYAEIQPPGEWLGPECIREGARAWVRDPKGCLGFGLLRPGYHGKVGGSLLWLSGGDSHGGWIGDDHRFSPVAIPILQ